MTAVGRRRMDVGGRVAGNGGAGGRRIRGSAGEDALGRGESYGSVAHAESHDARRLTWAGRSAWTIEDGGHASEREVAGAARHFRETPPAPVRRNPNLGQDLVGSQGRRQQALEERGGSHAARA